MTDEGDAFACADAKGQPLENEVLALPAVGKVNVVEADVAEDHVREHRVKVVHNLWLVLDDLDDLIKHSAVEYRDVLH